MRAWSGNMPNLQAEPRRRPALLRFTILGPLYFALLAMGVFARVLLQSGEQVLGLAGEDLNLMILPFRQFGFGQMLQGHLPLWNPHNLCGTPFFANFQSALLYPPNWVHLLLPLAAATNWSIVLEFILAGWFTSLWCRGRGLSIPASLLAGTAYMFCGPFLLHMYAGHLAMISAMAWTPLIFRAADVAFERPTLRWTLVGALAVSMSIFAGHPQSVYYTALAVGLYTLLQIGMALRRRQGTSCLRAVVFLTAIYVGGAMLAAMQLLAGLQAVDESARGHGVSWRFASAGSLPPENLVTLVTPHFFGGAEGVPPFGREIYWEVSLYVGAICLALGVYGALRGQRGARRFSTSILVVCLYVQNTIKTFYYASSCSCDDERSEESCEHDDRPTTDRVSACNGRREAWSKPVSCHFARTAD